jgi:hypothetical protein
VVVALLLLVVQVVVVLLVLVLVLPQLLLFLLLVLLVLLLLLLPLPAVLLIRRVVLPLPLVLLRVLLPVAPVPLVVLPLPVPQNHRSENRGRGQRTARARAHCHTAECQLAGCLKRLTEHLAVGPRNEHQHAQPRLPDRARTEGQARPEGMRNGILPDREERILGGRAVRAAASRACPSRRAASPLPRTRASLARGQPARSVASRPTLHLDRGRVPWAPASGARARRRSLRPPMQGGGGWGLEMEGAFPPSEQMLLLGSASYS